MREVKFRCKLLEKIDVRLQDGKFGRISSVSKEPIESKSVNGNNRKCESLDVEMCESVRWR